MGFLAGIILWFFGTVLVIYALGFLTAVVLSNSGDDD